MARHSVEASAATTREGNPVMLTYKCGDSVYLAGVNGRSIMGVRADVSGKV
jgi:hypothetical protein